MHTDPETTGAGDRQAAESNGQSLSATEHPRDANNRQATEPQAKNRLAAESSPYLLQHRDNPVHWYAWGAEALEGARRENKPILLSVGYSACHWCHVMAHESFENPAIAALMNEHFINVKVDREERPDIDSVYMSAVQEMTGRGGWPLTAFLTPEGVPFYGGTYFPPEPRHGMPSFPQVLLGVSQAFQERREDVERTAGEMQTLLERNFSMRAAPATLDAALLDGAFRSIASRFDPRYGGFGAAPKFPQPLTLEFLLRYWKRETPSGAANQSPVAAERAAADALRMVDQTLTQMAAGGMYDQVGGGFSRYSTDAQWLVPHFEKMLYDNALLGRVYLHAYQITGDAEHRRIVDEILGYVLREMRSPDGGFYSAQDADSEGVEGKFYVWSPAQVDAVLGDKDGLPFRRFYDITETGNWEGTSIPRIRRPIPLVAEELGMEPAELSALLARGRRKLYAARSQRTWPGLDDKVLTAWNAMMLATFAEASRVLGDADYQAAAVANAEFLLRELRRDGRLLRTFRNGEAKIPAFLEDHALLADALVTLYETTFDPRWVREATTLADTMIRDFWDEEQGVFYDTPAGGEQLVVRPRDLYDNPMPAGTSAAAGALQRLAALTGEPRYSRTAVRVLEGMGKLMAEMPSAFSHLLSVLDRHLATPREVAIVGERDATGTRALLDVVFSRYLPNTTIALLDPDQDAAVAELIPLLQGRVTIDGKAAAYVCEHYTCQMPVAEPEALLGQLGADAQSIRPG